MTVDQILAQLQEIVVEIQEGDTVVDDVVDGDDLRHLGLILSTIVESGSRDALEPLAKWINIYVDDVETLDAIFDIADIKSSISVSATISAIEA